MVGVYWRLVVMFTSKKELGMLYTEKWKQNNKAVITFQFFLVMPTKVVHTH